MLQETSDDVDLTHEHPFYHLIPRLFEYSKQVKRDNDNIKSIHDKLLKFLQKKKITSLLPNNMSDINEEIKYEYDDVKIVNDIINVIDAGNATVDTAVCACLFRIKQNPEVYEKLLKELKDSGIKKAVFSKKLTPEILNECDYFSYVVKEVLRMDPPTIFTTPYRSYED